MGLHTISTVESCHHWRGEEWRHWPCFRTIQLGTWASSPIWWFQQVTGSTKAFSQFEFRTPSIDSLLFQCHQRAGGAANTSTRSMRNLHSNHHIAQALEQQPFLVTTYWFCCMTCMFWVQMYYLCVTLCQLLRTTVYYYKGSNKATEVSLRHTRKTHLLFLCNLLHSPDILCSSHISVSNSCSNFT